MWSYLSILTGVMVILPLLKLVDIYYTKKYFYNIHIASTTLSGVLIIIFEYLTLINSFQYKEIFENSSRALPLIYKVSVLWASRGGSILLWLFLLELTIAIVKPKTNFSKLLAVLSEIPLCVILVFLENPFVLLNFKPNFGEGMNLLLQTPEMVVHPILLFAGYAAIVAPIVYVVDEISGRATSEHYRASANVAWALLTMGIMWGALWSYKVLGWGGFWGWDPVENSSLLPWLLLTSAIHLPRLYKKWQLYLLQASYATTLLGTMVTRSGLLSQISNHAWWSKLSLPLIYVVCTWVVLFFVPSLYYTRKSKDGTPVPHNFRSLALLISSVVFVLASLVVLIGIYTPIVSKYLFGNPINVTPGFYKTALKPLGLILFGIVPLCFYYYRGKEKLTLTIYAVIAILSFVAGYAFTSNLNVSLALSIGLPGIVCTVLSRSPNSQKLVHLGLIILFVGVISAWNLQLSKTIVLTSTHPTAHFDGYNLTYLGSDVSFLPKRGLVVASFKLRLSSPHENFVLHPLMKMKLGLSGNSVIVTAFAAIPAIRSHVLYDVWVVPDVSTYNYIYYNYGISQLFSAIKNGDMVPLRCEITPGMLLVWLGSYLATLGAVVEAYKAVRQIINRKSRKEEYG